MNRQYEDTSKERFIPTSKKRQYRSYNKLPNQRPWNVQIRRNLNVRPSLERPMATFRERPVGTSYRHLILYVLANST